MLDFASSGRSGRRNALPDILGSPAGVSPTDLPLKLAQLSVTGMAPTHKGYSPSGILHSPFSILNKNSLFPTMGVNIQIKNNFLHFVYGIHKHS